MSRFPLHRWAMLAGLLPFAAVVGAVSINILAGMEACVYFTEGCSSVSRAMRWGPGLWWFKILTVPAVFCMIITWRGLPTMLRRGGVMVLGVVGALFLVVYAAALGTDGDVYRWMRRYGVVVFFGFTGLAHLFTARNVGRAMPDAGRLQGWAYIGLVGVMWGIGVISALKRRLFDDPSVVDRLQNSLEWWFALLVSLLFVALAFVLRRPCDPGHGKRPGFG